jgi:hypothetical protein
MTLRPEPGESLQDVIAKLLTNDIHRKKKSEFIEGDGTTLCGSGENHLFENHQINFQLHPQVSLG